MMRRTVVITVLAALTAGIAVSEDNYYYSDNQQFILTKSDNQVVIGFSEDGFGVFTQLFLDYSELVDSIPPEPIKGNYYVISVEEETNIDSMLEVLNEDSNITRAHSVYLNDNGGHEVFTNEIVVKKSDLLSDMSFDSLLTTYDAYQIGQSTHRDNVRYVCLNDSVQSSVLEISNRLYENDNIEYSHPVLWRDYEFFYEPVDPYFQYQYNLHNETVYLDEWMDTIGVGVDIDALEAWQITRGNSNVIVGVIDDGIGGHVEFSNGTLIDTFDITNNDSNCIVTACDTCAHGYAVASLIMAAHDQNGMAGIVPDCKFLFIKIVKENGDFEAEPILAESLVEAAYRGAKIINCSWGCPWCDVSDDMVDALNAVTDPSIYGYSCVVVFAAGNHGGLFGGIAYPANMPQTLAVGATDSMDTRWWYSATGNELDVVATSGNIKHNATLSPGYYAIGSIITADRPDDYGYNPYYHQPPYISFCQDTWYPRPFYVENDYFCAFGGTSGACPLVAGIAAMIVSRRPDLADSNYTIYDIIRNSSVDQVGPDTGYVTDTPGWDTKYGWGRVSAFRALLAVCRGDANNDGTVDPLDIWHLIDFIYTYGYQQGQPVPDLLMGDANCDADVNLLDILYLIEHLYRDGEAPPICFDYGD